MGNNAKDAELFCSSCGGPLHVHPGDRPAECPLCKSVYETAALTEETEKLGPDAMGAQQKIPEEKTAPDKFTRRCLRKQRRRANIKKFHSSPHPFFLLFFLVTGLLLGYAAYNDGFLSSGYAAMAGSGFCFITLLIGYQVIPIGDEKLPGILGKVGLVVFPLLFFGLFTRKIPEHFNDTQMLHWKDLEMETQVSHFQDARGYLIHDTRQLLDVELFDCERAQFRTYIEEFRDRDFTLDCAETPGDFSGKNPEGYDVSIRYSEENQVIELTLRAPLELDPMQWPEIFSQIPAPDFQVGNVLASDPDNFTVVVGPFTREQFGAYCRVLENSGFDSEVTREKAHFRGYDDQNYHVDVTYSELGRICIEYSVF